ncbi:PAS domain-containing protein [Pedobacter sp. HDW13]|uniref:PAS domain-containing sensor histidine kinase n=1 Tax=unclassified Pedobacter TaxID=2628915 RepID=UPI000F5AB1A2|nr:MULTISPECIES: PAS domain-containing sensor histidine kinase [unclassified Pedobacter]QIL38776.1 PAS domain-containing protein [Pedobacter sp. HDW13]RQO80057.1 ATPase [Pedobacter sp. KBW01]
MAQFNTDIFCKLGGLSADGYFIFDQKKRDFVYLNNSIGKIWELETGDILEKPALLLKNIHPEDADHVVSCYDESLEAKAEKKYEFRLLFNDHEKYLRASVFNITDGADLYLLGIVEDTTVMRHNKIHIEQINSRKNITLEVLAHDLKEPLGMIKFAASSIEERLVNTGDLKVIEALSFIKDMCARNLLLVRSMINREFLKSSVIEIGKERADLVWELRDVVRFYKRSKLGRTKNIQFTSSADKIYLQLDSMKFLQVINNLISNALKFTADDGYIGLHAEAYENKVLISVTDDGIGIPDELQAGLFDRLPQTLRPGLKGQESGGFGMGIIKAIVELHRGKIWFTSKVGVGTTFYIELPK